MLFRTSNKTYKIRRIVKKTNHQTDGYDVFGITIPSKLAQRYSGTHFTIYYNDDNIILQSGART